MTRLGLLADRLSVNIELPSEKSLSLLAPNKTKSAILAPMGLVRDGAEQNKRELALYRHAPPLCPCRAEHPDDRRRQPGDGLPHSAADRRSIPEISVKAGVLFSLHSCSGGHSATVSEHKTAFAAGAPTVPGRLAAALYHFTQGKFWTSKTRTCQSLLGPQMQLGPFTICICSRWT